MIIIPAIDILKGAVVRLQKGDYKTAKIYDNDPAAVAKHFAEAGGVEQLHVVDLDGALAGEMVNTEAVAAIRAATDVRIDISGGIRTSADVQDAFKLGANTVAVGSAAVKSPKTFKAWLKTFGGENMVWAADLRDGNLSTDGWLRDSDRSFDETLADFVLAGLTTVYITDILRDGTLSGPSIPMYKRVMDNFPTLQVVAHGGVSSIDDLRMLRDEGLYGVIVGKAIYEEAIPLEALREFAS